MRGKRQQRGVQQRVEADHSAMPGRQVVVRGAREHNLQGISVSFPHQQLVVVTGPSGSGKSSLAVDTIYAEGRRRYLETLSYQSSELLVNFPKPKVDLIEGLPPTIAFRPSHGMRHPYATVGTITHLENYFRVVGARLGQLHCPRCDTAVCPMTLAQISAQVFEKAAETRFEVFAPITVVSRAELPSKLRELRQRGFVRIQLDGNTIALDSIEDAPDISAGRIDVQIDRLRVDVKHKSRLMEALELALTVSDRTRIQYEGGTTELWSPHGLCLNCNLEVPPLSVELLSFTHHLGACHHCRGLGWSETSSAKGQQVCATCQGSRLSTAARAVRIGHLRFHEIRSLPASDLMQWVTSLELAPRDEDLRLAVVQPFLHRLQLLIDMGLGYLPMARGASAISVGEAGRLALLGQLDTAMSGVLCVVDEPSRGLHRADHDKMFHLIELLRSQGNTVLIVEHDLALIRRAELVIDMGPGAGNAGGQIISQGSPTAIADDPQSITGQFLAGTRQIAVPERRRPISATQITIQHASTHNLKGLQVAIPLGVFVCITGVSGSGKTALIHDTLTPALQKHLQAGRESSKAKGFEGFKHIHKLIAVDQQPIGRHARSNPATFTGLWDVMREVYALLPDSRARGYRASRFSFNAKEGRCGACQGAGVMDVDLNFLPDAYRVCEECNGLRFNHETLQVRYKGLNVAELLGLSVAEAQDILSTLPKADRILSALSMLGLGYLQLGQAAPTLSGGEAQRLKLATELARRNSEPTLYILDEPSAGLHLCDIELLLKALHGLVNQGHSLIVIEHQLDIIKQADYLIDLGPGAGPDGGTIVATGPPESVATEGRSVTGQHLKHALSSPGIHEIDAH